MASRLDWSQRHALNPEIRFTVVGRDDFAIARDLSDRRGMRLDSNALWLVSHFSEPRTFDEVFGEFEASVGISPSDFEAALRELIENDVLIPAEAPLLRVVTIAEVPEMLELAKANAPDAIKVLEAHAWSVDPTLRGKRIDLFETFPDSQLLLLNGNRIIGECAAIPVCWDGDPDDLPDEGFDWAVITGFHDHHEGRAPTTLVALNIDVSMEQFGKGRAALFLEALKSSARQKGFRRLLAPVRPTKKAQYPLVPMENYVTWQDRDEPFDPWIRTHSRLGAKIVKVCPRSMTVQLSLAECEKASGLRLPETGRYVVPDFLVPLEVDVEKRLVRYVEPNVWMVYALTVEPID